MEKLTIAEALKQGYTSFGYENYGFQTMNDISDLEIDFTKNPMLFSKDKNCPPSISAEDIKDMIADHVESNHGDSTGDDTEQAYQIVKGLNFDSVTEMVNKALEKIETYTLTNILLTP